MNRHHPKPPGKGKLPVKDQHRPRLHVPQRLLQKGSPDQVPARPLRLKGRLGVKPQVDGHRPTPVGLGQGEDPEPQAPIPQPPHVGRALGLRTADLREVHQDKGALGV
jgi:hypothetical protein